jgi:16S rRNA (adenine1518-N6/adenine1519-N6)-dimethyltransferase
MKLSEMKEILTGENIQLTKSLGQNFLHDQNQLMRIAEAAELGENDKVLEIGPGLGPLTDQLLAKSERVLALEKDLRLVEVLRRRYEAEIKAKRLDLRHEDALDYLRMKDRPWGGWKLVSNLPYSVASPILVELALSKPGPDRIVATLQLEVAKRLMASSGNSDYGVLTLLVQLDYEPIQWFKIPSGCFFPEPDVDSACVVLQRRTELLPAELKPLFVRVVKTSFSQRRKMMPKLLRTVWPGEVVSQAFANLGLSLQARAESLALKDFIALTRYLAPLKPGANGAPQ